jgi:hypothetical protein
MTRIARISGEKAEKLIPQSGNWHAEIEQQG